MHPAFLPPCVTQENGSCVVRGRHYSVCRSHKENAGSMETNFFRPLDQVLKLQLCSLEVARTRLREEGTVYRSFWQTLGVVYQNEGRRGLYRGLCTQLLRQIPNTAIMMSTYELTVYLLTKWLKKPSQSSSSRQSSKINS